jgi:hypothetical protein
MPYLMPGGSTASFAPTANLSVRNTPTAIQFLDWNRWLPTIYPGDAFGANFKNSPLLTTYQSIRAGLVPNNAASYSNQAPFIWELPTFLYNFRSAYEPAFTSSAWTPTVGQQWYSIAQWLMVKNWELNQEFGLQGMPQVPFGPQADVLAWYSQAPFQASPNMLHIPQSANLGNGLPITHTYLAYIWYHLQLVLNAGNGQYIENSPIDFGYVYNYVSAGLEDTNDVPDSVQNGPLMLMWLIKAGQDANHLPGPDQGDMGWSPQENRVQHLFDYANLAWRNVPVANAGAAMQQMMTQWLAKVQTYTPQQFYAGGWATAADIPNVLTPDSSFADYVASMIVQAKYFGVSTTLLTNITTWAKTMWPAYNWANLLNVTCVPYQDVYLNCPVP